MAKPIAICLEDLAPPPGSERFLRCVAVPGRAPGLRLGPAGEIRWRDDGGGGPALELWVSADERLVLLRPEGAPAAIVRRAGRQVEAPAGKPVVILDRDVLEAGGRALRIHVHGAATRIDAPAPFAPAAPERGLGAVGRVAAAMAMGAVLGCGGGGGAQPAGPTTTPAGVTGGGGALAPAPDAAAAAQPDAEIEIIDHPPEMVAPEPGER